MKVNLKIHENNKVETIQHEVEEVNLFQVTQALNIIKDVVKLAEEDDGLKQLLQELFDSDETIDEADGQRMVQAFTGAFVVLMVNIPTEAFRLLSALSGIEYDVLMKQKVNDVFDIYDAIIQVNDIDKLIERGKKSLALTKAQTKIVKLFQRKEQEKAQANMQQQLS